MGINDTLTVPGPSINGANCVWTKRKVLQVISSVFNLLGYYFFPTVLDTKLFRKTLWIDKCGWDIKLNEE